MRRFSLELIALFLWGPVLAGAEVDFADANLKAAVEAKLGISDPTSTDMLDLQSLDAHGRGIKTLDGLEFATNLQSLLLYDNQVGDISPLSDLTRLVHLDLDDNQISSITPLSSLLNLRVLDLDDNRISHIDALSGLTNLDSLYLEDNQLDSVSALSDLNLTYLSLEDNQIRNISPLSSLTNLTHLYAENNGISDISSLAGLNELRYLDLHENNISDLTSLSGLGRLEYLDLSINRISDISALSELYSLHTLNIFLNRISDIRPLFGLTGLQKLHLHYNQISDISALLGLTNLQVLELHKNPLNRAAYCSQLPVLMTHNPNIRLSYGPNTAPPESVWASDGLYPDRIEINWSEVCNGPDFTSYYRVSRATAPENSKVPVGPWQSTIGFTDLAVDSGIQYRYWIQTSTDSQGFNAVGFSRPVTGWLRHAYSLTLSSSAGGSVVMPGPGTRLHPAEGSVTVKAASMDSHLYVFSGWTGTAVDAGRVADPEQASTAVTVDDVYTLDAHFVTTLETVYVDDSGSADPAPGDSVASDPLENGTLEHPFDRIQEAIEVAVDGVVIVVLPGTYYENIDLLGKQIELIGTDPNGRGFPIIDGGEAGPAVSFGGAEDPNCRLTGFVITRGKGELAGGIDCQGSSPTITNCLVVGNRAMDPNGAAIYCRDSSSVFVNCTIADNIGGEHGAGVALVDSPVSLMNSIVWGNTPRDVLMSGDSVPLFSYSDIVNVSGPGNVSTDPLFAQSGYWVNPEHFQGLVGSRTARVIWIEGDYHLQSAAGRWRPITQEWIQDELSSLCIDSGHPMTPIGYEPVPHGNVINLGAYGGTFEGSKSSE